MEFLERVNEKEYQLLTEIKANPDCRIFLYGAGYYAHHYWEKLQDAGVTLSGVFVDDGIQTSTYFGNSDICIQPLSELRKQQDVLLIVAFYRYKLQKLEPYRKHIRKVLIYDFSCVSLFRYDYTYIEKYRQELEIVYRMLSDQLSRDLMIAYVNQRISGKICYCQRYIVKERYFSCMPLSEDEYYVDCGAYVGDTIEVFRNALAERELSGWKKIVAFEPDRRNFTKLQKYCSLLPDCEARRQGVYDENGNFSFSEGYNKSSSLGKDATNCEIKLVKLDDALDGEPVSLIKMDIQGAELAALQGAKILIEKNQPKLAICLAHRPQDLFAIPLLLKKMDVHYEYYLCMQEALYSDISLVAIPK